MEQLANTSILIGKEAEQGRLLIAVTGFGKTAAIGTPGNIPASVSRCRLADGVAHARIDVNSDGRIILTNLKTRNITLVNGFEIVSKAVTNADTIELGKDRYKVNLALVLEVAKKIKAAATARPATADGVNAKSTPAEKKAVKYNISHLERVWSERQQRLKALTDKQKRTNLIRSGCMIFSPCAIILSFWLGPIGYVCTGIGVIGMIYGFIAQKNDNSHEVKEQIQEDFEDNYVCPNPDCNRFLGSLGSYKLLKKQHSMKCPYCKCEFVEK
ncbi:MAG: hypothetical protein HDS11_06055 [Bacteroides sp.]|nr:hypothetical protein [Bacteroides sp.]